MKIILKYWWIPAVLLVGLIVGLTLLLTDATTRPDGFGKQHPIPDGLEYNLPLDPSSDKDMAIDSLDNRALLQVWNGIQGGIYNYDFYYSSLPAGEVFLRCYEVTENILLSEERLRERSTVPVDSTLSFSQLVHRQEFTIYEGDWEDYYAARIEVWFKDAGSGQEKKLCEKVYRVEGWMR